MTVNHTTCKTFIVSLFRKISFVLILRAEAMSFTCYRRSLRVIVCIEFYVGRQIFTMCVFYVRKAAMINSENTIAVRKIYGI